MTHVENIHEGDWVLIVGHTCKMCGQDHEDYTGTPFQVIAFELPFLLLKFPNGHSSGLDTREWKVKKIGTRRRPGRYVDAWFKTNTDESEEQSSDDYPRCVKCGERLRQMQVKRKWRWRCPAEGCGYDGGPVEADY